MTRRKRTVELQWIPTAFALAGVLASTVFEAIVEISNEGK